MAKAERAIDPSDFTAIPRTREFINSLPEQLRICSEHGEPVVIRESDSSISPGPNAPFAKAAYVACCEMAIDKLIDAIRMRNLRG